MEFILFSSCGTIKGSLCIINSAPVQFFIYGCFSLKLCSLGAQTQDLSLCFWRIVYNIDYILLLSIYH